MNNFRHNRRRPENKPHQTKHPAKNFHKTNQNITK